MISFILISTGVLQVHNKYIVVLYYQHVLSVSIQLIILACNKTPCNIDMHKFTESEL